MTDQRLVIRFLPDEGVPITVRKILSEAGQSVIFFNESGLAKGSADQIVCATGGVEQCDPGRADGDMRKLARNHGVGVNRFKRPSLPKFDCRKPQVGQRKRSALSPIEHEWNQDLTGQAPRMFVVMGETMIRTHR